MRHSTVRTAFFTLRAGSAVSAAATETISVPPNANATTNSAVAIPAKPLGANPSPVKLDRPGDCTPGSQPKSRAAPTSRNPTIAATLSRANQNSNSPKFFTLVRFTAVSTTMNTKAISHTGRAGKMVASRPAAPSASAAMTTTSCSHHSQPTVAPATGP